MKVALVTSSEWPDLTPDDQLLLPPLRAAGLEPAAAVWDQPRDWTRFGAAVLRSPWDYTGKLGPFLDWVADLERAGVALWNPPAVVRWNADKRYLLELAERGVPVVPTRYIPRGARHDLGRLLAAQGWTEAVVKPAVSAGGRRTWRASIADATALQAGFDALCAEGAVLVQPFLPEVQRDGEWGLVFLGGAFSHAVRKRAAAGDFRVQERWGGTIEAADAPPDLVRQARESLDAARALAGGSEVLYARVDGVVLDKRFVLMEAELLEPSLCFLQAPPAAPGRFARALADRVEGEEGPTRSGPRTLK